MFNLTVDEAHTFFVGEQDWLVHNTGIEDCRISVTTLRQENQIKMSVSTGHAENSTFLGEMYLARNDGGMWGYIKIKGADGEDLSKVGLTGREFFNTAYGIFHGEENVKFFRGVWSSSSGIDTNYQIYRQGIMGGLSPAEAALNTPTGKYARGVGLTNVEIMSDYSDIAGGAVIVNFRRP